VFDGDMPCQLAASLVMVVINPQPSAKPVEHLDDLSGALFGEQIDLEIEMIPAVGDHPQAVLLHQHKGCQNTKAASKTASSEVIEDSNG
jgi:hypothetical protein